MNGGYGDCGHPNSNVGIMEEEQTPPEVEGNLDKSFERIARNVIRRQRQAASTVRVAVLAREIVRRLPNPASLDQSELVACVALRLRGAMQTGPAVRQPADSPPRDTLLRPNLCTVFAG